VRVSYRIRHLWLLEFNALLVRGMFDPSNDLQYKTGNAWLALVISSANGDMIHPQFRVETGRTLTMSKRFRLTFGSK
jgi:hypothetical protein